MQDIRVESWSIEDQTQTQGYVSRFEPSLNVPAFTQKDFHYSLLDLPQRDLHRVITNTNKEYTTPTLTPLHKRVCTKQRKKITTWWSLRSQIITWWSQKITNKTSLTNKILEDRFTMKSSSMWVHKIFGKENTKKTLGKNFLIDEEMKNKTINLFSFDFPKLWNK